MRHDDGEEVPLSALRTEPISSSSSEDSSMVVLTGYGPSGKEGEGGLLGGLGTGSVGDGLSGNVGEAGL
jgi:hypothetical protein